MQARSLADLSKARAFPCESRNALTATAHNHLLCRRHPASSSFCDQVSAAGKPHSCKCMIPRGHESSYLLIYFARKANHKPSISAVACLYCRPVSSASYDASRVAGFRPAHLQPLLAAFSFPVFLPRSHRPYRIGFSTVSSLWSENAPSADDMAPPPILYGGEGGGRW